MSARARGFSVALVVLIVGAAGALYLKRQIDSLDQPIGLTAPVRFEVPQGMRLSAITRELARRGVLHAPRTFELYARIAGRAGSIKAGEYEVTSGLTPKKLLEKMVSGQVVLHSFTIVEGSTLKDVLGALRNDSDVRTTLSSDDALAATLGLGATAPEGQLLPETYRFALHTADIEILRQAHAALVNTLATEWAGRAPGLPLHSPEELLIMASIVQKESGVPGELAKIAGLYLNRLALGMRLQADPTVIYGLGERYDGTLHTTDLREDTAYNTYTRAGLPPTPIALPGAAALHATAHPEKTDALYFVASGLPDGSHVFSRNLTEHNAAVERYLERLRRAGAAAAGSAPTPAATRGKPR